MKNEAAGFVVGGMRVVAALCALAAIGPGSTVVADEIHACLSKQGKLRIVPAGTECRRRENPLAWNQEGATGPSGPAGRAPVDVVMLSEQWGSTSPSRTVPWPNQPAAMTELLGDTFGRTKVDITGLAEARLLANVAVAGAVTPAQLRVQYSTDQTNWAALDGGNGPAVSIEVAGLKVSPWMTITEAARGDVFLRVVGVGGDSVADPAFGKVVIQLR